jgi:tubulin-specific chaperone A
MPPPSQLAIATSSVQRLVKEEASYHKELTQQQTRLDKLLASKDEGENAEFQLKQEASPRSYYVPLESILVIPDLSKLISYPQHAAIEETKAVFPPLRLRISDALQKLEDQLEVGQEKGATEAELAKAKEVREEARVVLSQK